MNITRGPLAFVPFRRKMFLLWLILCARQVCRMDPARTASVRAFVSNLALDFIRDARNKQIAEYKRDQAPGGQ